LAPPGSRGAVGPIPALHIRRRALRGRRGVIGGGSGGRALGRGDADHDQDGLRGDSERDGEGGRDVQSGGAAGDWCRRLLL
jgi:hypothetical protein